jgi:3,4-dihydroxy 2-butanone 4-phosphate synthase/GTP cyclohydrolase II
MVFATIPEAIADVKAGKFVILVDDEDRENEGDLYIAAEKCSPSAINFMTIHARGLVCLPITGERLDQLKIPLMVSDNTSAHGTNFTISIEARHRVTTGISAADRAETVRVIIDPASRPEDLVQPGHTFPLRAREGGVLVRAGHTEAAVDLARMAGLFPAGVICEIMNEDGTMARLPQLEIIAEKLGIKIATIADLIAYRRRTEKLVHRITQTVIPNRYGEFTAIAYRSDIDNEEHVALVMGDVTGNEPVLVRVHSECLTGEVFGSLRCDCGEQLLKAYALQDEGMDTVEANLQLGFPADLRDYGIGAQILTDLGVRNIKLMTNNPKKVIGLVGYGLKVVETVPVVAEPNPYNLGYLETKEKKMGHKLGITKNE